MTDIANNNPLLVDWTENFGLPLFSSIKPSHFEPAFEVSMKAHFEELKGITENVEPATFENTIAAFDRSGELQGKVHGCFDNLCSSNGVPELQEVEMKMAGPLAAYSNRIYTFPGLFKRIDEVHEKRHNLSLSPEQVRLIERFHLDFVRAGARFDTAAQARYAVITEEMANLETKFTQNILADESEIFIPLTESDLAGLPADLIASAKQAAAERVKEGTDASTAPAYVITLSRSLVEPFVTYSERRDLREKAWRLWTSRGELDPSRDNLKVAKRILELRHEQALMHGYATYADYATADTMAGTPTKVLGLLESVWARGKESIHRERLELENYIKAHRSAAAEGSAAADATVTIEPWDWRYYEDKVRSANYAIEDSEVKPYFSLEKMLVAIFDVANQLFNLNFKLREDLTTYHADCKVYEVRVDGNDEVIAIFLSDNYARQFKRSGAWMSEFRGQHKNTGVAEQNVIPIVINNNNFNRGETGDRDTLLSYDDARTLFHEFGHGLHGMLSNVTYQRLAGTSVLRDFVELPSQLYEHWLGQTEVLKKHARHYLTNEPIPDELLAKLRSAMKFGQGFATIEYSASALVDVALHKQSHGGEEAATFDIATFEKNELARLGMPQGIVMRHRPAHFQHLFSDSSYASAYYVYLWAEVLDADGFDAFLETGNCFDRATADRLKQFIYSAGNSVDPAQAFRNFRGRDPAIEPMLKKKGLL